MPDEKSDRERLSRLESQVYGDRFSSEEQASLGIRGRLASLEADADDLTADERRELRELTKELKPIMPWLRVFVTIVKAAPLPILVAVLEMLRRALMGGS